MDLATCCRRLGVRGEAGMGARFASCRTVDCEVFSPCAAAALYARPSFEREGGFDESFFCYLEDVDLGFRLRLRGERCVQVRRAEVLHAGSAISGHLSEFSVFHSYRNRIWLFAKNVPWPLAPAHFRNAKRSHCAVAGTAYGAALSARRPERRVGRVEGVASRATKPNNGSAVAREIDRRGRANDGLEPAEEPA